MPELIDFSVDGASALPAGLVDRIRSDAEAVGYARGWSQGLREARESTAAEHAAAAAERRRVAEEAPAALSAVLTELLGAVAAVEAERVRADEAAQTAVLQAAVTLAEAILGCELSDTTRAAVTAAQRATEPVPAHERVTVRISGETHRALDEHGLAAVLAAAAGEQARPVEIVADDTLSGGDAVATFGSTHVDARIDPALQRIRQRLAR